MQVEICALHWKTGRIFVMIQILKKHKGGAGVSAESRRAKIVDMLEEQSTYLNASRIAELLGVSRQIIVSDIALLRAQGHNILSTPRGYLLERLVPAGYTDMLVCNHGKEEIGSEFYHIVDNGGVVLDVSIDHPIYGLLSATLNIRSRYDADLFIEQISRAAAKPLSALTGGLHTHRIRCENEAAFRRICSDLRALGILVEM